MNITESQHRSHEILSYHLFIIMPLASCVHKVFVYARFLLLYHICMILPHESWDGIKACACQTHGEHTKEMWAWKADTLANSKTNKPCVGVHDCLPRIMPRCTFWVGLAQLHMFWLSWIYLREYILQYGQWVQNSVWCWWFVCPKSMMFHSMFPKLIVAWSM